MARLAVTYEQVAAVANSFYAQGIKNPGTKAIRGELSKRAGPGSTTGSPNTIQRHLNEWRLKDRPVEVAELPQLPPQLAGEIARALNAAASAAREKVEECLIQVQAELDELAATGEVNDVRIEEMTQALAARTSERDSMAGQLADRTSELNELRVLLAAAQEKCATMERELHAARAEVQAMNGRVDEIRQATERQLAKVQTDLDGARAGQVDAERRAADAEKSAASAEARLEGERSAKKVLEVGVAELRATVKRLDGDAAKAHAAEATAVGLREQLASMNGTVEMLKGMLKQRDYVPTGGVQRQRTDEEGMKVGQCGHEATHADHDQLPPQHSQ
jgi:colicin import membrane protein